MSNSGNTKQKPEQIPIKQSRISHTDTILSELCYIETRIYDLIGAIQKYKEQERAIPFIWLDELSRRLNEFMNNERA